MPQTSHPDWLEGRIRSYLLTCQLSLGEIHLAPAVVQLNGVKAGISTMNADPNDDGALLDEWRRLEAIFSTNHYYGSSLVNSADATHRPSTLLITAPHSVNHHKDGIEKWADRFTGGLALLLGELVPCSTLVATGQVSAWTEWNARTDRFATLLRDAVDTQGVFVVDLHGMSDKHRVDICVGLGPEPHARVREVAHSLKSALRPLKVEIDSPFDGRAPHTVTSYVQTALRGNCLQVEVSARLRDFEREPEPSVAMVRQLRRALRYAIASDRWNG